MMSDRKQFVLVMVVAALFVGWLGWRGFEVISLNERLKADEVVASYPYKPRVLRVEGDTAIMSSLRSGYAQSWGQSSRLAAGRTRACTGSGPCRRRYSWGFWHQPYPLGAGRKLVPSANHEIQIRHKALKRPL